MFKHPSHSHLKNRALKRRISAHQYLSDHKTRKTSDYAQLRANQRALNKLKRFPELLEKIRNNLQAKQQQTPEQPQLSHWQQLLATLHHSANGIEGIEAFSAQVMDVTEEAEQLRKHSVLDCIFD